ncbi:TadE/TadG family type IV pilus assembly protein [Sulfitobacter sabulilitoris]|uniref:Pilus assembly protein n=1 Tax=Sulfitobacter sabulilitoris TaxID=2562655 RepID=A0A5S3PL71_9RHOB|nr:hypothetical protein [Sulfitobacter sabulilitoris]TMM55107.1 hypothetical protein FDT80_05940 [Sulfitobacter sabulilitoris]
MDRLAYIRARLSGFSRREDGSIAIEAVIILPLLFWAFLSMFSIFDAFRQYSVNQKVAYTIGDLMSRQTDPIDIKFLEGAQDMFDYMTYTGGASSLRLSVLAWNEADNVFTTDWSKAQGTKGPLTDADVAGWADRLPVMPDNERIVVVETWKDYTAPFATGLEKKTIENFIFTRPRYAPQVLWEDTPEPTSGV